MHGHAILITALIIFSLVAFMHLLRLIFKVEVIIGGKIIPFWVSVLGVIIPLSLAIWIVRTITIY